MAVLLAACSHSEDGGEQTFDGPTVMTFYVYSPESPALTRANTGYVEAEQAERRVSTLQIWVFKSGSGELVGYLSPNETDQQTLNTTGNAELQMIVGQAFGHSPENVDVYVLANFTLENSGLAFDASTTRAELETAMMGQTGSMGGNSDAFGLSDLTTSVPTDGLPMSGVLRNQPVVGEAPILRIGSVGELSTVKLVRMVSKIRFVFSRASDSEETVEIRGIELNGGLIPTDEYVFLEGDYDERSSHVSNSYVMGNYALMQGVITDEEMGKPDEPDRYVYLSHQSQVYEDLINDGVESGELTERGPFYLRESDKQLTGTISYALNGGETKQATFRLSEAGDFSRNHTWIVYAHYGTATMELVTVEVLDWTQRNSDPRVIYNW